MPISVHAEPEHLVALLEEHRIRRAVSADGVAPHAEGAQLRVLGSVGTKWYWYQVVLSPSSVGIM